MFVDDPRASIERAAGLVDDRVEALIQSVRERQRSMQSAWQADDAGTEELRVALQHYRTFWNSLEESPCTRLNSALVTANRTGTDRRVHEHCDGADRRDYRASSTHGYRSRSNSRDP